MGVQRPSTRVRLHRAWWSSAPGLRAEGFNIAYGEWDLDNPIKLIDERASMLTPDDVDWLVAELMNHYSGRIHSLSNYVYGSEQGVALEAFKEWSRKTLENGVETYLFKSQYWRQKERSIGPYLASCLTKLGDSLKSDSDFVKRTSVPICPACKALGEKEWLTYEGKLLRCPTCTKEYERLEEIDNRTSKEEYEYRIRKVFSLHSRKGRRCPSCNRFIPESFVRTSATGRVSCPYDDCSWFGIEPELEPMAHPLGQSTGMTISMNAPAKHHAHDTEIGDFFDACEITPDLRLEHQEKYAKELEIVRKVLSTQKLRLERQPMKKVLKKYLMYEAFQKLLEEDPEGMIGYLIHGKSLGERPIQSLIFQRYARMVENRLPFTVVADGDEKEVFSLVDADLNLFLGMSEFTALVRESGFISNNTHEVFDGAKCKGPCFIGLLCDITDENGKSLLSEVEYYTFSSIKMKNTVPENTMVRVVHFRIPPHYEMHSMVNLQRVRKRVVESINKRLHR